MTVMQYIARQKFFPYNLLFAAAFLILLHGCSENQPIKIGFVAGLSGRVADLGINGRNGAQLAVEEQNSLGGIKGRPLKLLVEDDRQDQNSALKAVQNIIDQEPAAIIGHMTSAMSMATLPFISKHNILMMSPTTTTNALSGLDDNFIRVCAPTRIYATKVAHHLLKTMAAPSVVMIYDLKNRSYTKSWTNDFRKAFEAGGGRVIKTEPYTSGPNVHFQKVLENVMQPDVAGLIICASSLDAAILCQQIRKLGWHIPVTLSAWASTEKLIEMGGQAVEGVTVSQFFDRQNKNPAYLKFHKKFKERFNNDPGFAAINSYNATKIVLQGLAEKAAAESLKEYILRVSTFDTLQGTVTIDQFGDGNMNSYISTVKDGQFVRLVN